HKQRQKPKYLFHVIPPFLESFSCVTDFHFTCLPLPPFHRRLFKALGRGGLRSTRVYYYSMAVQAVDRAIDHKYA
ncbi:MAG: hypothetical protein N2506_01720, partial [Dehalococcoidales bacterium]|nr:hypothetical protein [Dehalococcoidales bacterium]